MATARKGLNLNFDRMANLGYLDPLIPFARASSGTYLDFNDSPQLAAAHTPRFTNAGNFKRGWLIEGQRTNFCPAPGATFSESAVITPGQADPSGGANAQRVVYTSGGQRVGQDFSAQSAGTYTVSVWLKGNSGGELVNLQMYDNYNNNYASVSLVLTTGWRRYTLTSVRGNGFNRVNVSSQAACTFYLWGFQCEFGSFATSYIPTNNAIATRAYDYPMVMDNLQIHAGMNTLQGTVILDFTPSAGSISSADAHQSFLKVGKNNGGWIAGGLWFWRHVDVPNTLWISRGQNAFADLGDTVCNVTPDARVRCVYSWDGTKHRYSVNGGAVVTADLASPINSYLSQLIIGNDGGGGWVANAMYHEIQVLPLAFPDPIVMALSSPTTNPL